MIYILQSDFPEQANWHRDFYENLEVGLVACGYCLPGVYGPPEKMLRSGTTLAGLYVLTEKDFVFVTHYAFLDTIEVRQTKAKVIFHHHGSGVNPYDHWIDISSEIESLYNAVDIHTFCMPTQEKLVREKYSFIQESVTIGFPMDLEKFKLMWGKGLSKKKKIVVAGHIGPERQFYLSTYLLKDLLPEYEVVFSVCEKENCPTGKWSDFYNLQRFIDMGFKFHFHPDQPGFYRELSDASHIFTCSLGDTFSVSILEGYLCGCIPIVPAIFNGWPMWMDYISNGYHPFEAVDVETFIRGDKTIHVDLNWFKPELVAKRLLEKIL